MEAEFYNEQPQGLSINLDSRDFLKNTAKWGRFLAICGFISVGIMVLLGLLAIALGSNLGEGVVNGAFVSAFYLIFGVIYLLPILYLHKFSSKMKSGLAHGDEEMIAESFKNLKSLFKFMGILTIIIFGIYALALVAITFGAAIGTSL